MGTDCVLTIDDDILHKFDMALELTGDNKDSLVEDFMKKYIAQSFSEIAASLKGADNMEETDVNAEKQNYGKALRKIPKWAKKPSQINHKIVRAYLQLKEESGTVTYEALQKRCDDKEKHADVYIATFATNFAQMKFDGDKSNGKVFEVDENGAVTLWTYVEAEIMKYKEDFLVHTTDYGYEYHANGSDIFQKKCPNCQGGIDTGIGNEQ